MHGGCMKFLIGFFNSLVHDERPKEDIELDNEYFPVQCDSEIAAGHPIVGCS